MTTRQTLMMIFACMLSLTVVAQDRLPAFPGADGYGKYVTGGRGGEVCYVTSLEDCSDSDLKEGTLRWALRHDNGGKPRTILFKTCGTILLTSNLKMQYPDVSILGQTAPGGGICIAGYKLYICKNNVIIRHIRFRAGDLIKDSCPSIDCENASDIILDHCSMTWSMEECVTWYDNNRTTIQWCIIGEGLYNSKNSKGARSYCTQWGGQWSTMHHCLLTNCNNRVPRFNGVRDEGNLNLNTGSHSHDVQVDSEFANNVIFNWGKSNSAYGGEDDKTVNNKTIDGEKVHVGYDHIYMINNYWRPGPATKKNVGSTRYFVQGSKKNDEGYGQWYLSGNKFETSSKFAGSGNQWKDENLELVNADNLYGYTSNNSIRAFNLDGQTASQEAYDKYILTSLPEGGLSGLVYESADEAYNKVCQQAGASLPKYDEVDTRLLKEAAGTIDPVFYGGTEGNPDRGIGIINSPNDIKYEGPTIELALATPDTPAYDVYPDLGMSKDECVPEDTDGDGMTDKYEIAYGFNPNDASDGAQIAGNGYTNLENFLNGVADGTISREDYGAVTAISNITTSATNGKAYNLAGQRVSGNATGITIQNGKKAYRK